MKLRNAQLIALSNVATKTKKIKYFIYDSRSISKNKLRTKLKPYLLSRKKFKPLPSMAILSKKEKQINSSNQKFKLFKESSDKVLLHSPMISTISSQVNTHTVMLTSKRLVNCLLSKNNKINITTLQMKKFLNFG